MQNVIVSIKMIGIGIDIGKPTTKLKPFKATPDNGRPDV